MKILLAQYIHYFPALGGASKANRLLLEGLAEKQHICRAVAPSTGRQGATTRAQFLDALAEHGIQATASTPDADVFQLRGVEVHAGADNAQLHIQLMKQIRAFEPTWTLVSEDPGQILLEAALEASPSRVIYLVHSPETLPFGPRSFLASLAKTALFQRTASIVVVSTFLRDYVRRWSGLDAVVLPLNIITLGQGPFPRFGSFDADYVTIINPCAIKGIAIFLALARSLPDVLFAAVPTWGTTPADRAALEQLPNVHILKPAENIDEIFCRTRILLVPSLWEEAFGRIAVEAMLRGIPVLASDVGGLPEAMLGVDYVLPVRRIERYEPRFDEQGVPIAAVPEQDARPWSDALCALLRDRAHYERLSAGAREAALAEHARHRSLDSFEAFLERGVRVAAPDQAIPASSPSEPRPSSEVIERVDTLSPERRALFALRLRQKSKVAPKKSTIPRREGADSYPLSFAQQRLWFLDQLEPGSPAYSSFATLRLTGPLQVATLQRSLGEIRRRHAVLRTTFTTIQGQPIQRIAPPEPFKLAVLDMRTVAAADREAAVQRLAATTGRQLFDLARGPLLRIALLRMGETEHMLLLWIHHIISDAWSVGIFIQELAALYVAYSNGRPAPLPEPPIQYADFSCWQREWLSGEELATQLTYWKRQLSDLPSLDLPTDRPRPATQTFRGAQRFFELPADTLAALQMLSRQEGATPFMTLLTAFQIVLARYSGQSDIVVGTPISNRNRSEVEGLIGFFTNTLVLRSDLSGNPTVREALRRVRAVAMEAYAHQDIPFEHLVAELRPERDLRRTPLFQIMFVLLNTPMPAFVLPNLTLQPPEIASAAATFDLTLFVGDAAQGLRSGVEYNIDLFDRTTIIRLIGHFQTVLKSMIADPDRRLAEAPLLTAAEQHQALAAWNDTQATYPADICIHQLFEAQAARTPHAVALAFDGWPSGDRPRTREAESWPSEAPRSSSREPQCLTYQELNQRANQLAHYLRALGVGPEVRVGICMERSLELVVGLLGIHKAGGSYVPLDPDYPSERLAFMLADAQAPALIVHRALDASRFGIYELPSGDEQISERQHLRSTIQNPVVIRLDADWARISRMRSANPARGVTAANLAYVIYTSGSTGRPKGAMNTHGGVLNRLLWMQDAYQLTPDDRVLQKTPMSFDVSVWEFFWPLLTGACLTLLRPAGHKDSAYLRRSIAEQRITTLHFVPAMLRVFLEEPGIRACTSLRRVICSGEALPSELLKRFFERLDAELYNLYGPTEAAVDVSVWRCAIPAAQPSAPIGRPIANTHLYVLDRYMHPAPIGVAGELYIGGVQLARGYLQRPDLTAERFVPNPFAPVGSTQYTVGSMSMTADRRLPTAGCRLYRTGDLVRYRPDGNIEFLSRIDYQVKLRGFRIELGEIETALVQHPLVREAVVVMREDIANDQQLAAYVVIRDELHAADGEQQTDSPLLAPRSSLVAELRAFLQSKLPAFMVPGTIVTLAALPLTPNGKVDRRALPAPERAGAVPEAIFAAPRTPVETALVRIWSEILNLDQVGIYDNFFDLRGHSLLALQVISRVRDVLQIELPLRSLFEAPTVADLSRRIEAAQRMAQGPQSPPIMPVSRELPLPLSFAQQRLWFLAQLTPDSPLYNVPAALRLTGRIDLPALRRSFRAIVQRHEALRTCFIKLAGQPTQVIAPELWLPLPVIDLSALSVQEREAAWRRRATWEARRPFDLSRGPLLRLTLLRLAEADHILLLTMHHIVSDGWSIGVLFREVGEFYVAYASGRPASPPDLPIQYADYAVWQRQWLQGAALETRLAYWKSHLAGAPPALDLPVDRPRPPIQTFCGGYHRFALPAALLEALHTLNRREGATLFMTLLAAFQILLARYTAQDSIVVGTPIANRNRTEIESLIGFFVNTLALRTDLSGNPSVRELLIQVRDSTLQAYTHQDLPFEYLVTELQLVRDTSRHPLFQVMFVLQNAPLKALDLPGLALRPIEVESETAKFELTLSMTETVRGMDGVFEYNADLFDAATVRRMAKHLQVVLEGIVATPDMRLADVPLLTKAERRWLLEWNDAGMAYPQDACIHTMVAAQAERSPAAIAVVFDDRPATGDRRPTPRYGSDLATNGPPALLDARTPGFDHHCLTYSELNRRANQLAQRLLALRVGPETWVGLCLDRSIELVVGALGILKAGGGYVPLDPSYPQERLAFMLADAGVSVLITHRRLLDRFSELGVHVICLDTDWPSIAHEPADNPADQATAENPAYLIYTSGSTGKPKGVVVCHANVARLFEATQPRFRFDERDVWTLAHSFAFDFSVWEIWGALRYGGRLVAPPYWAVRSPETFYQILADERVTVLNQTPALFRQLLRVEANAMTPRALSLRLAIFGGEALEMQMLRPWFDRHGDRSPELVNMYGITETTVHVTYRPLHAVDLRSASGSLIGRAIPDLQIYILDRYLQLAPIGVPGEIYVGGSGLARGYQGRPDLTAERFIPNPFAWIEDRRWKIEASDADADETLSSIFDPLSSVGLRLYKTGDVAHYLPNGDIEYLGRLDAQVKIRGFRIELGEIKAVLEQHPAVRDCWTVVREDIPGDKRLVTYVVPSLEAADPESEHPALTSDPRALIPELRRYLQTYLPDYLTPAAFVLLDALPLTPNGKVDRRALPAPGDLRAGVEAAYIAPRTELEQIIAAIWQEALQIEKVGVHDNFFDLGGHSLLVVQVHSKIQELLKQDVPMIKMFEHPSINALALYLDQGEYASVQRRQSDDRNEKLHQGKDRLLQQMSKKRQKPME